MQSFSAGRVPDFGTNELYQGQSELNACTGESMTILFVAIVALGLLVVVAAVISGFLWISERKTVEPKHRDLSQSRPP